MLVSVNAKRRRKGNQRQRRMLVGYGQEQEREGMLGRRSEWLAYYSAACMSDQRCFFEERTTVKRSSV
jgi:hypothetical protein